MSRQGGDEFVILLPQIAHAADAALSAQKMLAALLAPHDIAGNNLQINASIGISTYPNDGPDAETLLRNADIAMYHAKESGRNTFQFFRADMNTRAAARQTLEDLFAAPWDGTNLCCTISRKLISRVERLPGWRRFCAGNIPAGGLFPPCSSCPSPKSAA